MSSMGMDIEVCTTMVPQNPLSGQDVADLAGDSRPSRLSIDNSALGAKLAEIVTQVHTLETTWAKLFSLKEDIIVDLRTELELVRGIPTDLAGLYLAQRYLAEKNVAIEELSTAIQELKLAHQLIGRYKALFADRDAREPSEEHPHIIGGYEHVEDNQVAPASGMTSFILHTSLVAFALLEIIFICSWCLIGTVVKEINWVGTALQSHLRGNQIQDAQSNVDEIEEQEVTSSSGIEGAADPQQYDDVAPASAMESRRSFLFEYFSQ